jgi:HPt (histidine-containing phosphotransfer) domain-containing protein
MDIIYIAFLTSMNHAHKIKSFSVIAGMFLLAALATTASKAETAFAQNMSNQTVVNQTTVMNQTSPAMNQTSTNQTESKPKLTTSDLQDIRKSLEEIRKDIADGKATEALQAINDMDNKLLVSMSDNPPPMLEKSSGNDNNK